MKKSFVTALLVAFTIAWVAVSAMPVPVVASAGPQSSDSVVVNPASIIDEVVWVVGDEAILKSDVEQMRLQAAQEGIRFKGNPDCSIPEQIAVQKLFLHQAWGGGDIVRYRPTD